MLLDKVVDLWNSKKAAILDFQNSKKAAIMDFFK